MNEGCPFTNIAPPTYRAGEKNLTQRVNYARNKGRGQRWPSESFVFEEQSNTHPDLALRGFWFTHPWTDEHFDCAMQTAKRTEQGIYSLTFVEGANSH
jgi:hypothetical protein